MASLHVRRLAPDDVDAAIFRALRLRALGESPHAFATRLDDALQVSGEQWRQQLAALATFAARLDDREVGVVRGAALAEVPGGAILRSLWVASEARGHGVGAALVQRVIAWARSEAHTRLFLHVRDDNHEAIRLYERLGFEVSDVAGARFPRRERPGEHQRCLALTGDR